MTYEYYDNDEPDPTRHYHRGNPESVDAYESLDPETKRKLRAEIRGIIRERGEDGATCDEIEVALKRQHQTVSPRITELLKDTLITRSGERRPTRSGRTAAVYITTQTNPVSGSTQLGS